jgi:Zn-dependent peptidase ImmA (M78 family)
MADQCRWRKSVLDPNGTSEPEHLDVRSGQTPSGRTLMPFGVNFGAQTSQNEMPRINPAIMEWARETAGLSLEDAVAKLAIRPSKKATAVERLQALERGHTEPTRTMIARMAKVYRRPLLTFYLTQPPAKGNRGQDFRTLPSDHSVIDDAVVDALIREVRVRQSIVLEVLVSEEESVEHAFVGSIRMQDGTAAALNRLHEVLDMGRAQYRAEATIDEAFKLLREHAERAGVYVILQGDLGSHHSTIGVETFRGFALADRIAPFIVINDHDSPAAWSFTLLHELVHIFLGETGVSGARADTEVERFCDDAASAFLLPDQELVALRISDQTDIGVAQREISEFARPRKLSHTMVAYRLLRAGAISYAYWRPLHAAFRQFWLNAQAQRRHWARQHEGGPSYYVVRRHRIGDALIDLTRRMLSSGALTTVKAAKVLAIKPQNVGTLLLGGTNTDAGRVA